MPTKLEKWTIMLLLLLFSTFAHSQNQRGYSRSPFRIQDGLTITPRAGLNIFFGDLVDKSRSSYSAGVTADREMSKFLSLRAQVMGGAMKGTQIYGDTDKSYAYFENIYVEGTVGGTYRPLNHLLGYFKERSFQPYALVQAGLVYYNTTEYWGDHWEGGTVHEAGSVWRKAAEVAPLVGLGCGTSIWFTPKIKGNLEIDGNLVLSDKMDGHDEWYGSTGTVYETDPADFYYTITFGISYLLNDSRFRNEPRYNRKTYQKSHKYFQKKNTKRKPSNHLRRR